MTGGSIVDCGGDMAGGEIMTMDGGLERLVRILHEFCMCPPPPDDPVILYGLTPPAARQPKPSPSIDKPAAYRFSLAFQLGLPHAGAVFTVDTATVWTYRIRPVLKNMVLMTVRWTVRHGGIRAV